MEIHIEGTLYGGSYRGYNEWTIIYRVQCMDTLIHGTIYGDSYREYNV